MPVSRTSASASATWTPDGIADGTEIILEGYSSFGDGRPASEGD